MYALCSTRTPSVTISTKLYRNVMPTGCGGEDLSLTSNCGNRELVPFIQEGRAVYKSNKGSDSPGGSEGVVVGSSRSTLLLTL